MAIPTSRAKEVAEIRINHNLCNVCGLCVEVCNDSSLFMKDGRVGVMEDSLFGCIGCGHCMAICPNGAIEIHGREISPNDIFELSAQTPSATYGQFHRLLQQRRSIREFKNEPIDATTIKKILDTAKTAPMGLPPSDVSVVVFDSKQKVRAFAQDYCDYLQGMRWLVSGWFLAFMRPFWGKSNDEMFRGFLRPLFSIYIENMKKGINYVNYDAPLMMYFYGSPYSDPADPIIAATYAMLAAESLGLGTCMLGGIHPFLQSGKKAKRFRAKYGICSKSREGLFLIMGHPAVKYDRGIKRTFASEVYADK